MLNNIFLSTIILFWMIASAVWFVFKWRIDRFLWRRFGKLIGALFVMYVLFFLYSRFDFIQHGQITEGHLIKRANILSPEWQYIQFATPEAKEYKCPQVNRGSWFYSRALHGLYMFDVYLAYLWQDNPIKVIYNPSDPGRCEIKAWWRQWLIPCLLLGIVIFLNLLYFWWLDSLDDDELPQRFGLP
jgi:hypothetical protein